METSTTVVGSNWMAHVQTTEEGGTVRKEVLRYRARAIVSKRLQKRGGHSGWVSLKRLEELKARAAEAALSLLCGMVGEWGGYAGNSRLVARAAYRPTLYQSFFRRQVKHGRTARIGEGGEKSGRRLRPMPRF